MCLKGEGEIESTALFAHVGREKYVFAVALGEESLGDGGIKPVGCLRTKDAKARTCHHIGEPMTVVIHPEEPRTCGHSVARYAYPGRHFPVFASQNFRAKECCRGVARGEGVARRPVGTLDARGIFERIDADAHQGVGRTEDDGEVGIAVLAA